MRSPLTSVATALFLTLGLAAVLTATKLGPPAVPHPAAAVEIGPIDHPGYQIWPSVEGLRAANQAQHLSVRFDRRGILLVSGDMQLGLSLRTVGYSRSHQTVGEATWRGEANRAVDVRPRLTEWYVNRPAGVEQGFTVGRAISKNSDGPTFWYSPVGCS